MRAPRRRRPRTASRRNYDRAAAGQGDGAPQVFHLAGPGRPTRTRPYLELPPTRPSAVHAAAKDLPASAVTGYLIAAVICAVRRDDDRPPSGGRAIHLDVPVDLRSASSARPRCATSSAWPSSPTRRAMPTRRLPPWPPRCKRQLDRRHCEPASLKRRMMSHGEAGEEPASCARRRLLREGRGARPSPTCARRPRGHLHGLRASGACALDACRGALRGGHQRACTSAGRPRTSSCAPAGTICASASRSRFVEPARRPAHLAEVLAAEGLSRGYLNANRDAPAFHRPGTLAAARKAAPVPSVFPPNSFERKSTRVRTVLAVLTLICDRTYRAFGRHCGRQRAGRGGAVCGRGPELAVRAEHDRARPRLHPRG